MAVRGLAGGERAALIINECQLGIIDEKLRKQGGLAQQVAERGTVQRIAELAATCRASGVLVVHSTIVMRQDRLGTDPSCLLLGVFVKGDVVEGHEAARIHPELAPQPGDYQSMRRHGLSPFHGTELESILRHHRTETVIVTGVSCDIGIPGACLEAINRGFRVVVPRECVAASSSQVYDFQLANTIPLLATVTGAAEVRETLLARERAA